MLMSQVILLLEVLTAVLCLVLIRQVFHAYRQEMLKQTVSSTNVGIASEESLEASPDTVITLPVARIGHATVSTQSNAANSAVELDSAKQPEPSAAASEEILNDYIGGFFDAAPSNALDITEFKAPVPEKVVASANVNEQVEEIDDSIITVAEEAMVSNSNKMSEKVVHAMLDEAKLVYNS